MNSLRRREQKLSQQAPKTLHTAMQANSAGKNREVRSRGAPRAPTYGQANDAAEIRIHECIARACGLSRVMSDTEPIVIWVNTTTTTVMLTQSNTKAHADR